MPDLFGNPDLELEPPAIAAARKDERAIFGRELGDTILRMARALARDDREDYEAAKASIRATSRLAHRRAHRVTNAVVHAARLAYLFT